MAKFIAEIGNNHNGSIELAKKIVDAAVVANADIIKFQIYNLEKFIEKGNPYYNDFINEKLSFEAFAELKKYIEGKGKQFLATPLDEDSLQFLLDIGVSELKISSGDMNNWPLLEMAARSKKKIYISMGGGTIEEVDKTVSFLEQRGVNFTILHCVINYPSKFEELNLNFVTALKKRYPNHPIGYSDHSLGIEASLGAIALGAEVIEKHFTIDRSLPGGDNNMSILPEELARLVQEGTNIEIALGKENKSLSSNEVQVKKLIRRVFFAKRDISSGQQLVAEDLLLLRGKEPDRGLAADDYFALIQKNTKRSVKQGELIQWDMLN